MSLDFAYVAFVNNDDKYIQLMKCTIESVKYFSKYPIIVYCIDMPDNVFTPSDRVIIRHIKDVNLPSIFYYKPYVILDAIKNGLISGYYIEADDVITPHCDKITYKIKDLTNLPISPIHPEDVVVPTHFTDIVGSVKTQHYVHAAHILFKNTHLDFFQEWFDNCLKSWGVFWDESVLNCMYWKYGCKNHYLDIIDPWYEQFYTNPSARFSIYSYHGCKDSSTQNKLFNDMKAYYDTYKLPPLNEYATHIPVLQAVMDTVGQMEKVFEYGMGNFSTKFLSQNCQSLLAVEMQDRQWYTSMLDQKLEPHVALKCMLGEHMAIDYFNALPEKFSMVFVDGHGSTRWKCINEAFNKTDIVIAHDTETAGYNWHLVRTPDKFIWIDVMTYNPWTSIFTTNIALAKAIISKYKCQIRCNAHLLL